MKFLDWTKHEIIEKQNDSIKHCYMPLWGPRTLLDDSTIIASLETPMHTCAHNSPFYPLPQRSSPKTATSVSCWRNGRYWQSLWALVDRMKTALEEVEANLTIAQNQAKAYAGKLRWSEIFCERDEVVLSTCNLSVNRHLLIKLCQHWFGPYSITKVVSPVTYTLNLHPAWHVHRIFHVSNSKR